MRVKNSIVINMLVVFTLFITLSYAFAATANNNTSQINISDISDKKTGLHFEKVPERVVVLDWDLLEQLLTLDIIPVGATETAGYKQWVVYPELPESIEEIGTRAEPNLEKIADLKPDVILATSSQQDLLPILEKIAPVVYLPNFAKQDDSALVAIENFNILAKLFNKQALAQQKLADSDKRFDELKQQLQHAYTVMPEVDIIRFSNLTTVFFYSDNSTVNYVMKKLGLKSSKSFPAQPWGIEQRRINELQHITDGYVLYLLPFPDEKKLQHSILWQAMPFVRNNHVHSVRPVWNYGGMMSLQLMAEAFTESLLDIAPTQ